MSASLPLPADSLDLIPVPTLALRADGVVSAANGSALELCGRDDLIGATFASLLHPKDVEGVDLDAAAGDALRLLPPDCTPRFVRLFSRPVDGGGALVCLTPAPSDAVVDEISGGLLDATLLARAVHAADNSIVVADVSRPEQPLVFANQGFLKLTGYEADDVMGRNCRFLQVPGGAKLTDDEVTAAIGDQPHRENAAAIARAIARRERVDGIVLQNYTADGDAFYNELYLTPVDDGEGVTHYIGVQNDVTDRVLAQRRLQRQAAQLKDIIDSMPMPIGLLEVSEGGRIRHVLANASAAEAFDLDAQTVVGLDGLGFRGKSRTVWIDAVHRAEATGAPIRFQALRGGEQTYEMTISPVRDTADSETSTQSSARRTRFFYLARDVSAGIQMESDILQISARELSRVARDIHDGVGQTLVGASMLSSALAAELGGAPQEAEAVRLQDLVRSALSQLRQFALGLDPVDIDDLGIEAALARLAADVSALFGIDVTLNAERCPDDLSPDQALDVYRIAQEALTNAVRHGHAEHIAVEFVCRTDVLGITVTDDGDGMAEGAQDGMDGMGLRTMRGRARRLGGPLEILPNPSGGTVVQVRARRLGPAASG